MDAIIGLLPFLLGAVVVVIIVGLIAVGVTRQTEGDPLQERMAEFITRQQDGGIASLEEIELDVPFSQRVLLPILENLAKFTQGFTPQEALEKTQRKIDLAGNPNGLSPSIFWTIRIVATVGLLFMLGFVTLVSGNVTTFNALLISGGGGLLGFVLPPMWLGSKISRRQDDVLKSLPDALDLLTICVEAGLGFDGAMGKVAEKWENEMSLAFDRVLTEIQVGKKRSDALRAMSDRLGVQDVTTFTASIIQADQLGVNITNVLRIQSEQMRLKRRQRAEEKAGQAPVKMVIPMVFLIFPTIYLVLLGPAGIQICEQFHFLSC